MIKDCTRHAHEIGARHQAASQYTCFSLQGTVLPPGTEYVPMIWRAADATPVNVAIAKQSTSGILLGFNEPNEKVQANNTVEVSSLLYMTESWGSLYENRQLQRHRRMTRINGIWIASW